MREAALALSEVTKAIYLVGSHSLQLSCVCAHPHVCVCVCTQDLKEAGELKLRGNLALETREEEGK